VLSAGVNSCPQGIQHCERSSCSPAVIGRLNHCTDIAALGGNAGSGEVFDDIDGKNG
jgi:hypothetical protein